MKLKLDFLKKATKRQLLGAGGIICVLIFILYYSLLMSPVVNKLLAVSHEVGNLQNKLDNALMAIDRLPAVKKEIEELSYKIDRYSSKLPREEEFPEILENLSEMAQNTGVKITKILPRKGKSPEESPYYDIYRREEIDITAQCGYHQLGNFIEQLENAERFMEVSNLRIDATSGNPKRHDVALSVRTYILQD